jgi:murein lipoprotein
MNAIKSEETPPMSKILFALTSAALLGLSGCADLYVNQPAKPAAAATPAAAKAEISAEAKAALASAQAAAKDAQSKNALWTTAQNALNAAEAAAAKGDSDTVMKQAKIVNDHVQKGLVQLNYPMLKVGD